MVRHLPKTAQARKYAEAKTCPLDSTPTHESAAHHPTHDLGVVPQKPSFMAHISKVIGRKEFCYELRISKSLLDQWMSGEKKDPIERVRDIMRIGAKHYPDLPLDIAQDLIEEFGGFVTMRRKTVGKE